MLLEGKTAIVTGGVSGIGLAVAQTLAASGARISVWDLKQDAVDATVTQLRELGEHLVDIHGQHAWQSLTRADSVRALVDGQAGVDTAALQSAWTARRQAQQKLDDARSKQADLDRERERLQWQIAELDKLAPQADEWDELNTEHQRLSHGQAILDAARLALDAVSEADDSADSLTSRAIDALDEVAGVEPNLANALEVLRSAQAQLQDAAHSINSALRHTELDPDRLQELDSRMSLWLRPRYSPRPSKKRQAAMAAAKPSGHLP